MKNVTWEEVEKYRKGMDKFMHRPRRKVKVQKLEVLDEDNKIRKVEINGNQLIFEYPWYCQAYYQDGEECNPLLKHMIKYWYYAKIYRNGEDIAHVDESFYYYDSFTTIKLLLALDFELPEAIEIYRDMCCVKALLDGKKTVDDYDEDMFEFDQKVKEYNQQYIKNGGTPTKEEEELLRISKEHLGLIPETVEAC